MARRRPPLGAALLLLALAACRQDMHDQAKIEPLEASAFFSDGMGARQLVAGTVPRGMLREDRHLYAGMTATGELVRTFPFPVTRETFERGRERFDIYCSPCHGLIGDGEGMIVERGFKRPASFHDPRLREAPAGYFFDVITHGFGQMSSYAGPVPPLDRWAIVAYIRALQLSQHAPVDLLTPAELAELTASEEAVAGPDGGGSERR